MTRTMKFISVLFAIFTFLAIPKNTKALQPDITELQSNQSSELEQVISVLEKHIKNYIEELKNGGLADKNKAIPPRQYLTTQLKEENFTEEEISEAFEEITKKRKEKTIEFAKNYIDDNDSLSKRELVTRLEEEYFSDEEIQDAIKQLSIDWEKQAKNAAEHYINQIVDFDEERYTILSRKILLKYLIEEKKFARDEATAGIKEAEINWKEQAFKQAKYELSKEAYSKINLMEKLIVDEFSRNEAVFGINKTATNWMEQARKKAEIHVETSPTPSRKELRKYLKQEGFTDEEVVYAEKVFFGDNKVVEEKPKLNNQKELELQSKIPLKIAIQSPLEHQQIRLNSQPNKTKTTISPLNFEEKRAKQTKKTQIVAKASEEVVTETVAETEEKDEIEETNLFDNPIFAPFIIAVIAGNLYLYQKM